MGNIRPLGNLMYQADAHAACEHPRALHAGSLIQSVREECLREEVQTSRTFTQKTV